MPYGRHRHLLQPENKKRQRFRARRKKHRSVVFGICIRNVVFFGSRLYRLCRAVRLEIRHFGFLDRSGKCADRLASGMGDSRQKNPHYDKIPRLRDNAGILRETLSEQGSENCIFPDSVPVPDSLYSIGL